jgi:ferrous iron transport protein B
MEMPLYKVPSLRTVWQRMSGSGWMFVRRAGTLILASMVVVWALLYYPAGDAHGDSYDRRIAALEESIAEQKEELEGLEDRAKDGELTAEEKARREELARVVEPVEAEVNRLRKEWTGQSLLARAGRAIEPAVRPLGWDWRLGMAALASFPAREVVVGTLGMIFNRGKGEAGDQNYRTGLGEALRDERWDDSSGRPLFTVPVALSVMVFFALCCQCASTLAVIRRETNSWRWPVFTFVYMTALAYVGALLVYQVGTWLS